MKCIETGSFPIADIDVGTRLREVDELWVAGLAASIAETGLQHPIQLLRMGNSIRLVAGAHRLRAYELLGRSDIPAKLHEPDTDRPDLELRLAEIDENLSRRELSAIDRAVSVAERRHILDELHGETRGRKKKEENFSLFSVNAEIANRMGLHERTVKNALKLSRVLSPQAIRRIKGSRLADHQTELANLVNACLKPVELDAEAAETLQLGVLDLMLCEPPKARTVKDAVCIIQKRPKPAKDSREAQVTKAFKLFLGLDATGKKHLLLQLQGLGVVVTPDKVVIGASRSTKAG